MPLDIMFMLSLLKNHIIFFKYATIEDGKITSWTGENLTAGKIL